MQGMRGWRGTGTGTWWVGQAEGSAQSQTCLSQAPKVLTLIITTYSKGFP